MKLLRIFSVLLIIVLATLSVVQHRQIQTLHIGSYANIINHIDDSLADLDEYERTHNPTSLDRLQVRLRTLGMETDRLNKLSRDKLVLQPGMKPPEVLLTSLREPQQQTDQLPRYLDILRQYFRDYKESRQAANDINKNNRDFIKMWYSISEAGQDLTK